MTTEAAAKTVFVLRDTLNKYRGKPIYFRFMTAIGPCGTTDPAERAEFDSREAAMQCPAFYHALSCYEPEEVPADAA